MILITTDLTITEEIETTRTYKLASDKIQGYTDKLEALQQAIYKELNTEKYECPIYSFNYGIELESLAGKDAAYVKIEFKRRVKECLSKYDTIKSVDNFKYSTSGDSMVCTFDVISIYGETTITKEVNI